MKPEYRNNVFKDLRALPDQGVYLLKNEESKKVFIGYSSNLPLSLVRNLRNSNLPEFFELLEIVTDKINLRARAQFYKDQYCNLGYTVINPRKVFNYKATIDAINDFRHVLNGKALFAVRLVPRTYKALTVGVFDTITDAESFMRANYCNRVYNVVYADNNLTKEFLSK